MRIRVIITVIILVVMICLCGIATGAESAVEMVLKSFAHEPSIGAVQRRTLSYAMIDQEEMNDRLSEVESAFLLPKKIQIEGYFKNIDHNEDEYQDNYDVILEGEYINWLPIEHKEDEQRYIRQEWRIKGEVEWDLSRVVFNPDELRVLRENTVLVKLREDLLNRVTRSYFERRQLQVELMIRPPVDVSEVVRIRLRIQELTAELDALTGGWFSRKLEKGYR